MKRKLWSPVGGFRFDPWPLVADFRLFRWCILVCSSFAVRRTRSCRQMTRWVVFTWSALGDACEMLLIETWCKHSEERKRAHKTTQVLAGQAVDISSGIQCVDRFEKCCVTSRYLVKSLHKFFAAAKTTGCHEESHGDVWIRQMRMALFATFIFV